MLLVACPLRARPRQANRHQGLHRRGREEWHPREERRPARGGRQDGGGGAGQGRHPQRGQALRHRTHGLLRELRWLLSAVQRRAEAAIVRRVASLAVCGGAMMPTDGDADGEDAPLAAVSWMDDAKLSDGDVDNSHGLQGELSTVRGGSALGTRSSQLWPHATSAEFTADSLGSSDDQK